MKIGILVDGQAEYHSLPLLLEKIQTEAQVLRPLYCNMHPHASFAQIAHVAAKRASIFESKGITDLVVLIDQEVRPECAPEIAHGIGQELKKRVKIARVSVIVKVTKFENWLIADPQIFSASKLFQNTNRVRKAVVPDKADNVDALALLNSITRSGSFDKVNGAKTLSGKLDPGRAAENSRSLRRFLRVIGCPDYAEQSQNPIRRK